MKRNFLLLTLFVLATLMSAQHTNLSSYYSAAKNKKGSALKTALCGIISTGVTYRSYDNLWTDFQSTDKRSDGKVWDMYSGVSNFVFGTNQDTGSGNAENQYYNREHSFPKSWFGGSTSAGVGTDLFHLYPTDKYVNSQRSNYPFGKVTNPTYSSTNGFSKLGNNSYSSDYTGKAFEPNDLYKGDFARTYFYMVTMYENSIVNWYNSYSSTEVVNVLDGNKYPGLKTWTKNMFLEWAEADQVSDKETNRNNAVDKIQGNRNPFIDFPGLEQYIWGSYTDVAFDPDNYVNPYTASYTVATPTFSSSAGTSFSSSTSVTISCTTAGATIYYTTDGTTPSNSSTQYNGAITLTETTTIKAIAYNSNNESSAVAEATFTKSSGSMFSETFDQYTSASDGTSTITNNESRLDYRNWSSFSYIYFGGTSNGYNSTGCCKLGSGSYAGSMTASSISLTGAGTLTFKVKKYGSDTGTLSITVTGATASSVSGTGASLENGVVTVTPQSDWTGYTISLTSGTGNASITFATSAKRAYLDEIQLEGSGAPEAPTISPDGGTFSTDTQTITLACATQGATIYYTTDGTTPNSSSTQYTAPFTISASAVISAIAYNNGYSSSVTTATFTKTSGGGGSSLLYESFSKYQGTSDSGTEITTSNYTTYMDDTHWTAFSKLYPGSTTNSPDGTGCGKMGSSSAVGTFTASSIALTGDGTLTLKVKKYSSDTGTLGVTVSGATVSSVSGTGGTKTSNTVATITPQSTWTEYTIALTGGTGSVSLTFATSTKRAYIDDIELVSGAAEETTPADPTFSPAGGTYTSAQNVTISCATSGAVIHYTTDGSTPTASSPTYSSAISLDTNGTYTMKAIAVSSGGTKVSGVATAIYTIDIPAKPNAPRFSLAGGTYNTPQSIQVVADDDCTIKYYWGESSSASPTTNYTIGSNAVEFNTAGTYYLKAVAVKNNIQSDVTSAEYVYAPTSASGYSSTEFVKATSIDDLVDTRPCIIVCENQNLAFQTISSSKGIGVAVTINNNAIDISGMNTKPAVYTLGTSTVSGTNYMTFKSGGNYIKASASNSTNLATESSLTDNSRWSVSISSGDASMVSKISTTRMILYQTSGACFRNYASSNATASGYSKVQIYVGKTESAEPSAASVTTGIYRIKDAVGYLCINTDGTISKTDDPTNLGTIFTVVNNGSGNYKLEAQGKTIATYSGTSVSLSDNTTVNMTDGTNNQYIAVGDKYINADAKAGAVGAEWTFDEVETTDNDLPSITLNRPDQTGNTYYRTFFADFPFTPSSGTAYTVSTSGGMATTTAISGTVPANTAVLIISNESPINIVPQSDDINLSAISGNELVGTCQPKAKSSVSGTVYVFSKKDAGVGFYKYSGTTLGANKAYLVVNGSNAPSYILDFNSAATGIDALETETKTDGAYYDLSGRRILNPAKGVYIRNGKKVLVR